MAISKTAVDDPYLGDIGVMKAGSEFGSNPLPDLVEMQREALVEPPTNEFRAENQRDKLPQVHGWHVLIVPYTQPRQTRGGIYVPDETVKREQLGTTIGYVVSVGTLAYKDKEKFGESLIPWCKPGDYVIFGRYAGAKITMQGEKDEDGLSCRILNDDEILATVKEPADYVGVS